VQTIAPWGGSIVYADPALSVQEKRLILSRFKRYEPTVVFQTVVTDALDILTAEAMLILFWWVACWIG
jgi:hypothetical protein